MENQTPNGTEEPEGLPASASLAEMKSGVDHNILYMHGLYLPAPYHCPSSVESNLHPFTNAHYMLIGTAPHAAGDGRNRAQTAHDYDSGNDTPRRPK